MMAKPAKSGRPVVHITASSGSHTHTSKAKTANQSWSTRIPPPAGCTLLGGVYFLHLVTISVLAPRLLPHAYLAFAVVGIPWRLWDFSTRHYLFFLIDWCYFANAAVIAFLISEPRLQPLQQPIVLWRGLEAAMYVMADGPLATAIIAWRCSWVLGWADYTISVLIHLLPGLAVVAHRHAWTPVTVRPPDTLPNHSSGLCQFAASYARHWQLGAVAPSQRIALEWDVGVAQLAHQLCHGWRNTFPPASASPTQCKCAPWQHPGSYQQAWDWLQQADPCCWSGWLTWLIGAPVVFYLLWQLLYWFTVQMLCLSWIKQKRLDTSYKSLARRAQKQGGGPVADWVLQGSTARRITAFGAVQLGFTLVSMVIGIWSYHSWHVAVAWQVVKYALPLYAGYQDTVRAYQYQRTLKQA